MSASPTTEPRHTTAILTIVLLSYLMIVLDISIVITALPRMRADLGFSATGLSWVQNAYTLAFGGLLLLGARAGDIVGRRRMFTIGIAIFTAASFAVGVAQSPAWLIAARAVQGLGAAVLAPSTLALLSTSFTEGPERTRAVSYYGAVAGVGAGLGLVLGGILTSWLSWRVGFFINVPIGIAMIIAAPRFLPETPPRPGSLDLVGALCSTLGMTSLVYGIVRSADHGWADGRTVAALVVGVGLLIGLVVNEWRVRQPIMPLHLFGDRERVGAYAGRILYLGAMLGFWFFITQFLQEVYHYTPLQAGVAFLPLSVVNFVVALTVPQLTRRWGNARVLAVGVAVTCPRDGLVEPTGCGHTLCDRPCAAHGLAGHRARGVPRPAHRRRYRPRHDRRRRRRIRSGQRRPPTGRIARPGRPRHRLRRRELAHPHRQRLAGPPSVRGADRRRRSPRPGTRCGTHADRYTTPPCQRHLVAAGSAPR